MCECVSVCVSVSQCVSGTTIYGLKQRAKASNFGRKGSAITEEEELNGAVLVRAVYPVL